MGVRRKPPSVDRMEPIASTTTTTTTTTDIPTSRWRGRRRSSREVGPLGRCTGRRIQTDRGDEDPSFITYPCSTSPEMDVSNNKNSRSKKDGTRTNKMSVRQSRRNSKSQSVVPQRGKSCGDLPDNESTRHKPPQTPSRIGSTRSSYKKTRLLLERLKGGDHGTAVAAAGGGSGDGGGSISKASAAAEHNDGLNQEQQQQQQQQQQQVAQHCLLDTANNNQDGKNRQGMTQSRRHSRWNMALSRSKSMPMPLSNVIPSPSSDTPKPLRVLRVRRKAATKIQTLVRRFLKRMAYQRKRQLRLEYFGYLERQKENQQRVHKAWSSFEQDLKCLQDQHTVEMEQLRQQYTEKWKTWKRERLRIMEEEKEQEQEQEREATKDRLSNMQHEIQELRAEQAMLVAEISLFEEMNSELEEENAGLMVTNEKMMEVFSSLNQYARGCVHENKRLEGEAMIYNKMEVSKLRQQMKGCSYAAIAETAVKNVCRSSIYRYIHGLTDQCLVNAAVNTLLLCERNLGNELLDEKEAMELLEIDDSSTDGEDDFP